jgi:NAD(P)-dependent dehydrogenase (short-subunit alcohol dehydrogenase family)
MARKKIDIAIPDLQGKLAVVTGASDGLGLEIARRLAIAGSEVILPVRNPKKGQAAMLRIAESNPFTKVSTRPLDLASLQSVADLGALLLKEARPIDIWINNAGVMTPPARYLSTDGFELQFATNFLGHYALVGRVLPLLKANKARVITMSSLGSRNGEINFADLQSEKKYKPWPAYNQSKLALTLWARELERRSRLDGWGIVSNVAHPGLTATNLQGSGSNMGRNSESAMSRVFPWVGRHFPSLVQQPASGALPALYAATSPDAKGDTFYGPSGPGHLTGAPAEQAYYQTAENMPEAKQVWGVAETLTNVAYR